MSQAEPVCSFCGKSRLEVRKLIAGTSAYICDECIGLSNDIIAEEAQKEFPPIAAAEKVGDAMRRAVVGQPAAIAALLGALRQHLVTGIEPGSLPTPIVLLAGPAGCGKSTLARALVDASPLPAFLGDLDRVTATGYVGEDIEGFLGELLQRARHHAHAERGVLAIDNLDHLVPLTPPPGTVRDVSGVEVQRAMLRILEGHDCATFDGRVRHPQSPWQTFRTRGLMRVLLARTDGRDTPADVRAHLRERGVSATLLSRVHVVVAMRALEPTDLREVLTRPSEGLLPTAQALLRYAGVELFVSPAAVERMVSRAFEADDSAWSLQRQVSGLVHALAARAASGRVVVHEDDVDRVGS